MVSYSSPLTNMNKHSYSKKCLDMCNRMTYSDPSCTSFGRFRFWENVRELVIGVLQIFSFHCGDSLNPPGSHCSIVLPLSEACHGVGTRWPRCSCLGTAKSFGCSRWGVSWHALRREVKRGSPGNAIMTPDDTCNFFGLFGDCFATCDLYFASWNNILTRKRTDTIQKWLHTTS